jgi:hypothetical protein
MGLDGGDRAVKPHAWQRHGAILVCQDCGIARHINHVDGTPACDPTELDRAKARIHAGFLRKLAVEFPDHPWLKEGRKDLE